MKCMACDDILTDVEATRKDVRGEFIDMCFKCEPIDDVDNYEPDALDPDEEQIYREIDAMMED